VARIRITVVKGIEMIEFDQAKAKVARAYRFVLIARVILEQGKSTASGEVDRKCLNQAARYLDDARSEIDGVAGELGVSTEWWIPGEV
jgi:hypothetical protein